MATKTISITEESYKRLAMLKKMNESFSEIIMRLTGKINLNNYFGILSKESADSLEKTIKEARARNLKASEKKREKLKQEFS